MMICYSKYRLQWYRAHIWQWFVAIALALVLIQTVAHADLRSAVCRIYNQANGQQSIGSGTLIDRSSDGRQGLVLTCAHLFSDGVGDVVVDFPGVKSHGARLVGIDRQADLAALAIANPSGPPAQISMEFDRTAKLSACGFGSDGQYRCATGAVVGQATAPGQQSLLIADGVRSGDSGGGVFDRQGSLVAVVWGEAQGVTYASYGRPLRQFLDRMLGRPAASVFNCPNGVCPLPRQPDRPERNFPAKNSDPRLAQIQAQIARLQEEKQDRGDFVRRSELRGFAQTDEVQRIETEQSKRHDSLIDRIKALGNKNSSNLGRAAGVATVGLLGLSGPAGWGVLVATMVGGWWLGNRMKRNADGVGGRRRKVFPG